MAKLTSEEIQILKDAMNHYDWTMQDLLPPHEAIDISMKIDRIVKTIEQLNNGEESVS